MRMCCHLRLFDRGALSCVVVVGDAFGTGASGPSCWPHRVDWGAALDVDGVPEVSGPGGKLLMRLDLITASKTGYAKSVCKRKGYPPPNPKKEGLPLHVDQIGDIPARLSAQHPTPTREVLFDGPSDNSRRNRTQPELETTTVSDTA